MAEEQKPRRRSGRPPSVTVDPTITERIVNLIRAGNFSEVAAEASGIDRATYYRYTQHGREHKCGLDTSEGRAADMCSDEDGWHVFRDFCDAIKKARAEGEVALVLVLKNAARGAEKKIHRTACPVNRGLDHYPDDHPDPALRGRRIERNVLGLPQCECPVISQSPDWFAAARMLESFGRERWLRVERRELTGEGGGPVEVKDITEELIAESEKIARRLFATADKDGPTS